MCLNKKELILLEEPILSENPKLRRKKMWDLRANVAIKHEELLKQNQRLLYVVVISFCHTIMEDKVSCHENFATIKRTRDMIKLTRDMIKLLQVIKQLLYSNSSEAIHTVHNQVMATINLFRMRQERGQLPQNFREQFTAIRPVCNQL